MTQNAKWLEEVETCTNTVITTANDAKIRAEATGNVKIPVLSSVGADEVTAKEVLLVPNVAANLLSVSKIVKQGHSVEFCPTGCRITDCDGTIMATASEEGGIFKMDRPEERVFCATQSTNNELWHRRLGHLNRKGMKTLYNGLATGLDLGEDRDEPCTSCIKGKQSRLPFKCSEKHAQEPLELIHSDLCGPMETTSLGGSRYFFTLIDDHTRKVFIYFLEQKSQVKEIFEKFQAFVEKQTGKKIKVLRTDNGTEYVNKDFDNLLQRSGIRHQRTVPYTPEQNGIAERMNRTIVEKARSMLIEAQLTKMYWAEAVSTAVYLINRSPARKIVGKTPEEAWTGDKPDLSHLRVFGCKAMAHIPKEKRKKWDSKSQEYIFVGYYDDIKGYRLMDPKTKKIIASRDVIFFETERTNVDKRTEKEKDSQISIEEDIGDIENENEEDIGDTEGDDNENENEEQDSETSAQGESTGDQESTSSEDDSEDSISSSEFNSDTTITEDANVQDVEVVPRRSTRIPKPKNMEDYVTYLTTDGDSSDPTSVREALESSHKDCWIKAMEEERNSLEENQTWILVNPPENRKILETKWIFKTKRNASGEIERYKARLVAKGCAQKEGIDYNETYSPVIRYSSFRFIFALAVKYNLFMDHMDVVTAYLHGELEEEIYVHQPKEFVEPGQAGKVCLLKKAMYGLKQSGRSWNRKLDNVLKMMDFSQSKADQCVYYKRGNGKLLIIAVYVDDMLILSNDKKLKDATKKKLAENFKMKDLGEIKHCLGMRINRDRRQGKLWVDQSAYIQQMLERFNMADSKPVSTPLDPNQKMTQEMSPNSESERKNMQGIPYQEAVGSLLFASQGTRPDIAYAVGIVSKFNQNPGKIHWTAVKRIFRYLKGTINFKLEFSQQRDATIEGYSDADWANETDNRHSVTGYLFKSQGGPVSWSSRKQKTVALSTTEAEYMALSAACQESLWLRQLAKEIDPDAVSKPMVICCDNKGAVDLAQTSGYRQRTKHIDIRHHFIRECIEKGDISVKHIGTEEMIADSLTKGLFSFKHKYCTKEMGIVID